MAQVPMVLAALVFMTSCGSGSLPPDNRTQEQKQHDSETANGALNPLDEQPKTGTQRVKEALEAGDRPATARSPK